MPNKSAKPNQTLAMPNQGAKLNSAVKVKELDIPEPSQAELIDPRTPNANLKMQYLCESNDDSDLQN